MKTHFLRIFAANLLLVLGAPPANGQALPYDEGASGLAFALRKLPMTGSFLHITAHPDDEDNPLLVELGRGRGLRTGLLTVTRGDGGQNEIGPELFEALGIIRTEELMAMHRYDGAEQFFTRAYEFGYSFSVEETLEKWGKEEILADIVRVIRSFRPQVIVTLPRSGEGGGQHHQASARLAVEAFRAAADPNRFPEQIAQGLRPWQALKIYERVRWQREAEPLDEEGVLGMETGIFDPLFGKTYAQVGFEARSLHRCQGMPQIVPLPGPFASYWKLVDAAVEVEPDESDLFDGVETGLAAIEKHAEPPSAAPFLHEGLIRLQEQIEAAFDAFDAENLSAAAPPLAQGLGIVRRLRGRIHKSDLSGPAKAQIDFLLRHKESDFQEALRRALQLTLEAVVDDGVIVPGQQFELTASVANGGSETVDSARLRIHIPAGWDVEAETADPFAIEPASVLERKFKIRASPSAEFTEPYWKRNDPNVDRYEIVEEYATLPWPDPTVTVDLVYDALGASSVVRQPAEYRYEGPWVGGEKRHDLMVAPAVSLTIEPKIGIIPVGRAADGRQVRVTALYDGVGQASGQIGLEVPEGWSAQPHSRPVQFDRPGQTSATIFRLIPPPGVAEGEFKVKAAGRFGDETYRLGYQVIDYDHIRRRHLYHPAEAVIKTIDVETAAGVKIGYIDGVGDRVPEALRQLGVDFRFLSEDDLTFGDLSEFDAIVTGVRAYLVREDLKANNGRLLEWVENGGTLIVQYNKFEFNQQGRGDSPYAPYPAKVGRGRVTDENAPVEVLEPDNPVFNFPNRIDAQDWKGWVQERGLYFLGEKDERYRDLLSTSDPFEYNAGEKLGSLVQARYGKGDWVYVGVGLWRQLPAGVEGAYRLLANLISLPKAP